MTDENPNPQGAQAGAQGGQANAGGQQPNNGQQADPNAGKNDGTIVGQPADRGAAVPADWPADWRDKLAGQDKDVLKQLGTFQSPQDLLKSYREMQKKLSSGEYKKVTQPPGKDATPEQLAEWRKEQGIPETPDKYDISLDNGLVIGAQDKPIVDAFLKEMHAAGASNAAVKSALNAYYKLAEGARGDAVVRDDQNYEKVATNLRKEWGADFKRNQNVIAAFVDKLPEGFREQIAGARLADGSKLLGNADGIKFMLQMATTLNPSITAIGPSDNPVKTIADEKKTIMADPDYWKKPELQARYRELINAEQGLAKQASR